MQHDYEERSYMTGIVVSVSVFVSVSDTLLLRKGNKACLGGVQSQLRVFFCFFHWIFFYHFILLLYYYLFITVIFTV